MPRAGSGADGALQRLAGRDDLAPVIIAAMAADVVRALQLAAIAAIVEGLGAERVVARRMPRREGEVFFLGTAMGQRPSCSV